VALDLRDQRAARPRDAGADPRRGPAQHARREASRGRRGRSAVRGRPLRGGLRADRAAALWVGERRDPRPAPRRRSCSRRVRRPRAADERADARAPPLPAAQLRGRATTRCRAG
jgi:hypothetical protein